jgi:glycosyltransferase involved in cell wall biosynthesis
VKNNCTVNVIVLNKSNEPNKNSGSEKSVSFSTLAISSNNLITYLLKFPFNILKIRSILKKHKVKNGKNFIILYDGISLDNVFFILLGKFLNYRSLIDIVEDYSLHEEKISRLHALKLKLNLKIEDYFLSMVDGVIVLSSYLETKFLKKVKKDIKIINIPVSAGNLEFNPKIRKKISDRPFKFVYCGTYGKKDGIEILLEAFNIVSKKYTEISLILSGKSKTGIEELLNKYENPNIKFVGYIPEEKYYEFLADADALCMTRINSGYANAGFPFKLGEYLATGKPVITTDVSDVSNYLVNKIDAIIAEPSNVKSLSEALEYVILNPDESYKIGLNGRKKAFEFFNPQKNGSLLLRFLDSI